jgi:alginate O-acetyltransferase complex protein AlgJ
MTTSKRNGTGWTGENSAATIFVSGIVVLGLVTGWLSHRVVARRALMAFCGDPDPKSRVVTRLQKAAIAGETAFSETMGRHFMLAGLDTNLRYFLTGELASQEVMLGQSGWLFYKTTVYADPIADFQGTNHFQEQKLREIYELLQRVKQRLAERGIRFVVMILPNKEQIYDNFMPESVRKIHEQSRADLLVDYLEQRGNLEIVYPKAELHTLRDRYQLYYKHDTHWNELGAWVAAQQLMDKLYGQRQFLEDQAIDAAPASFHDLAHLINMGWYFDDDQEYRVHRDEGRAAPRSPDKLLWVGDSFQTAMEPVLQPLFSQVTIVHREKFDASILDNETPDVVVLQYVERSLGNLLKEEKIWQPGGAASSR